MLENSTTALQSPGSNALLVPYTPDHVATYHSWMTSPHLLHLTGSEALDLPSERASCLAWRADASKLTFIIADGARGAMVGDVNVVFGVDGDAAAAEVAVMVAVEGFRRRGYARAAVRMVMAYAVGLRGVERFVAKIVEENAASLSLFEKMGFVEERRVKAFGEVHLALDVGERERGEMERLRREWKEMDYAEVLTERAGREWV